MYGVMTAAVCVTLAAWLIFCRLETRRLNGCRNSRRGLVDTCAPHWGANAFQRGFADSCSIKRSHREQINTGKLHLFI